eukprot:TRINITY_DN6519_c0_g1_i1.p1 TRINITY_DN6519_c0_g1~~TRINITY_DN6519_c0_g1_i1.p1  ORF type:complete len:422 (+),score=138.24 TRINITY_DN6519_c0_g1_i1:51-1316(+)
MKKPTRPTSESVYVFYFLLIALSVSLLFHLYVRYANNETIRTLQHQIDDEKKYLTERIELLSNQIRSEKEKSQRIDELFSNQTISSKEKLNTLNEQLTIAKNLYKDASQKLADFTKKSTDLNKEIETLHKESQLTQEQISALKSEKKSFEDDIKKGQELYNQTSDLLALSKQQLIDLETKAKSQIQKLLGRLQQCKDKATNITTSVVDESKELIKKGVDESKDLIEKGVNGTKELIQKGVEVVQQVFNTTTDDNDNNDNDNSVVSDDFKITTRSTLGNKNVDLPLVGEGDLAALPKIENDDVPTRKHNNLLQKKKEQEGGDDVLFAKPISKDSFATSTDEKQKGKEEYDSPDHDLKRNIGGADELSVDLEDPEVQLDADEYETDEEDEYDASYEEDDSFDDEEAIILNKKDSENNTLESDD